MPSKSSWRSASPYVHCKPRERAHERRRTTDLTRRRPAQGDRRCALHGRYSARSHAPTPQSSTARSRMAGPWRSTPLRAEKAPGVLAVLTHNNMPRMNRAAVEPPAPAGADLPAASGRPDSLRRPAGCARRRRHARPGDLCRHADQSRVRSPTARRCLTCGRPRRTPSSLRSACGRSSSSIGDADQAIADAAVKIEQTYTMPDRHHNPMEPHATLGGLGR